MLGGGGMGMRGEGTYVLGGWADFVDGHDGGGDRRWGRASVQKTDGVRVRGKNSALRVSCILVHVVEGAVGKDEADRGGRSVGMEERTSEAQIFRWGLGARWNCFGRKGLGRLRGWRHPTGVGRPSLILNGVRWRCYSDIPTCRFLFIWRVRIVCVVMWTLGDFEDRMGGFAPCCSPNLQHRKFGVMVTVNFNTKLAGVHVEALIRFRWSLVDGF